MIKFLVNTKLNILNYDDSNLSTSKSFSKGVIGFSKLFQKVKPDIIIILETDLKFFQLQ